MIRTALTASLCLFIAAGGANAHILVEQYETEPTTSSGRPRLIVLSARDEDRLRAKALQLAAFLGEHGAVDPDKLADVRREIVETAASIRGVVPTDIDPRTGLDELGFDRVCFSALAFANAEKHTEKRTPRANKFVFRSICNAGDNCLLLTSCFLA